LPENHPFSSEKGQRHEKTEKAPAIVLSIGPPCNNSFVTGILKMSGWIMAGGVKGKKD
jgi:hypothetical protein